MTKGDPEIMTHQSKKKRDEDVPPSNGQKPIQLQRRRVWRACESCRRKKIKCDGCEPTCSQCTSSGSQCTWLQTKDRAALSRHYVQELEARLLHMESLFSQLAPVLEQLGPSPGSLVSGPSNVATPPPDASNPATATATVLRPLAPKESPSTPMKVEDDFNESFGQLALDEYGHMRWIGGSSTMSLIQSFRALTSASPLQNISPMEEDPHAPGPSINKLYFPASVFFGKVRALPGPEDVEYPERDLADKLVEAYFSSFHFLMPVIDKPSFLRQYGNIMDNINDHELARSEAPFLSLLFAVFACAAHLVQDARLATGERNDDGGMGMVYYERALILQYISHPDIQIAHVQCFTLVSSFLCSINCLPQAWILIGQAVRIGQDLGLHRSPRRLLITSVEKETRRKVWWGVYALDRMLALALGRPLGINDSDCDVEQPVEVDDEFLPEYFRGSKVSQRQQSLMAGSVALNRLYEIGGRVLRQVYALDVCKEHLEPDKKAEVQRTVEALDTELNKWCEDLPVVFKSQSETDEQVSMGAVLCSHYYSILTTLHRNLLPVKRDQPQPVTTKSTIKAISSARSCIRLAPSMKHVVPPSHHLAFFIQHLFSSAVILLLYAMHAPDPRASAAAMEEAKSSLAALESWEGTWPGARKCKELLMDLTKTASEAIAQAATQVSVPVLSSPPVSVHAQRPRSVTIAPATSSPGSGRVAKARSSRRNPSRDPSVSSSRRLAAVSPYRVDSAERARSTSRKRVHDESDSVDRSGLFYQTFVNPASGQAASSSHSSPSSVNLPSPSMSAMEDLEASPGTSKVTPYNYTSSVPSVHPSPPHFEYDYGIQPSPLIQSSTQQWSGTGDHRGLEFYPSPYGYNSSLDGTYSGFDGSSMTGPSVSPSLSSFAATGLPFRGLDYIRNFTSGGYSGGDEDSIWQSYDPGAFGFDPDLPFTLSDPSLNIHDTTHQA